MSDQWTQDEVGQLLQDHEFRDHVYSHLQNDPNQGVDNSIALQLKILEQEAKEDTDGLLSRDIFLANLTKEDKNKVNRYLDIALRFRKFEFYKSAALFYTRALIIAGVSRGFEGFQQKEFNVKREMRESQIEGLKKTNSWVPWRQGRR